MNRKKLDDVLKQEGFSVDHVHNAHGSDKNKFSDLYIGIGRDLTDLRELRDKLKELSPETANMIEIDRVDNDQHDDYDKQFVNVRSFWNE